MKTSAVKIFEDNNIPFNNSRVAIDAIDIERTFNLDEELTTKEWQVIDSLPKIGSEINKMVAEKSLSKVALFVIVSDVEVEDLSKLTSRLDEHVLYMLLGVYEPNEGEQNRVVAIIQ